MKTFLATLAGLAVAAGVGILAARAHESVVPHAHPHLHAVDGALLGYDLLALVALALFAVAGGSLLRARSRRK